MEVPKMEEEKKKSCTTYTSAGLLITHHIVLIETSVKHLWTKSLRSRTAKNIRRLPIFHTSPGIILIYLMNTSIAI